MVINAASSSAGLAAIQMANLLGGVSIALTTSEAKKAALLKAGARHVIVTGAEDFSDQVHAVNGGKGANVILDAVGGSQFAKSSPERGCPCRMRCLPMPRRRVSRRAGLLDVWHDLLCHHVSRARKRARHRSRPDGGAGL